MALPAVKIFKTVVNACKQAFAMATTHLRQGVWVGDKKIVRVKCC